MRSVLKAVAGIRGNPRNRPGKIPSGTIWPDGTWSLGFKQVPPDDDGHWCQRGAYPVDRQTTGGRDAEWQRVPLDLRNLSNSHKQAPVGSPPRGSKGITALGRKMIRGAGALLKRSPVVGACTFCTVTIPPLPRQQRVLLVKIWSELVRQLIQYLTRKLRIAGLPPAVLSVSEVQTKRLLETGEAYPHLHVLWPNQPGARKGTWAVDVESLKSWIGACLERLLNEGLKGHLNVDVRPVKGSIAAYMTKYMSKGAGAVASAMEDWQGCCIKQWWNLSAYARKWVRSETCKGVECGELLEAVLCQVWDTSDFSMFIWIRHVELNYCGGLLTVGYRGCLTDAARQDLTSLLQSA